MFSETKVTEIYCLADDFCKEFAKYQEKHMFSTSSKDGKHRNKPNRMSDAEIMLIMILFHSGGYRCFKHFYLEYVCKHLAHLFPRRVSYNRFVELKNIVQIEHSRHMSFNNFIANALSAITAYCFFDKKPAIEVEFINDGQLTLF